MDKDVNSCKIKKRMDRLFCLNKNICRLADSECMHLLTCKYSCLNMKQVVFNLLCTLNTILSYIIYSSSVVFT